MSKIRLFCELCGKEFFAYPSTVKKGRKYCSHKCYSEGNKGKNWKGSVRRGKGSRPNEPKSAIDARAKAKRDKHAQEIEPYIDIEKLKRIIDLKYCNSVNLLYNLVKTTDIPVKHKGVKVFRSFLRYKNLYDDVVSLPKFCETFQKLQPEEFEILLEVLKTCESFQDYRKRLLVLDTLNKIHITIKFFKIEYIQQIVNFYNLETNVFKKEIKVRKKRVKKDSNSLKTLPERIIEDILIEFNLSYVSQYRIFHKRYENRASFYIPDFVVDKRLIIEVNGDYWHGWEGCKSISDERREIFREKDRVKYSFYEEKEFPYIVIWEHEIKEDINKVKERIFKEVLNVRNNREII